MLDTLIPQLVPVWMMHPAVLTGLMITVAVLLEYNVAWRRTVHPLALLNVLLARLGLLLINKPKQQSGIGLSISAMVSALMLIVPFVAVLWFIIQIAEFQTILVTLLLWVALGQYQLRRAAKRIYEYLRRDKKQLARDTLEPFVLRDTPQLSPLGIAKATAETLILRHAYQQITVIFWFALTNIWVALLYRLVYELAATWNPKQPKWCEIGVLASAIATVMQWPAVVLYSVMVMVFNPHKPIIKRIFDASRSTPGTWCLSVYGAVCQAQLSGAYSYAGTRIRKTKLGSDSPLKLGHIPQVLLVQKIWLGGFIILCGIIVWALSGVVYL